MPKTDSACKFLTKADASAVFGTAATAAHDPADLPLARSLCLYTTGKDTSLESRVFDNTSFFAGDRTGWEALAGVGDKAAIHVDPKGTAVDISVVKHGKTYSVFYTAPSATDRQKQLIAVVKKATNG